MPFSGFKKQLNKTSQFLSEKVGGNKGSELDEDIIELGRKLDVVNECVEGMQTKTKEYLQPNPAARKKMAMQSSYQKARGQVNSAKYPQPEYSLGKFFRKYGERLDGMSSYSSALTELGTSFNELSIAKDNMEMDVTQNFLDPLYEMQQRELKEISHHRKKLEGRRLNFDYKKSKGDKVTVEELEAAENKFVESKKVCINSMADFVDNDVEYISQLLSFATSIRDYHKQCTNIFDSLTEVLSAKLTEAESQSRSENYERYDVMSSYSNDNISASSCDNITPSPTASSVASPKMTGSDVTSSPVMKKPSRKPCCRAIYKFETENEDELAFEEGAIIQLTSRVDENWLEGSVNGRHGYFPESFVEIIVPIPGM